MTEQPQLTRAQFLELASRVDNSHRWPDNDELAALNTITPEKRIAAAALVTEGIVVSCCQPPRGPESPTVQLEPAGTPQPYRLRQWFAARDGWHALNDRVEIDVHGLHSMTHLDSLGHFFLSDQGFGGAPRPDLTAGPLNSHAIDSASGGILSRGILVDAPRQLGKPHLGGGEAFSLDDMLKALEACKLAPQAGDILVLRFGSDPARMTHGPGSPMPGLSIECAEWLHRQDFSVIVTDAGLDASPSQVNGLSNPWHLLTLAFMGIRLVDLAALDLLAETCKRLGTWEFLMTIAPPMFPNASGAPVNPLAVF